MDTLMQEIEATLTELSGLDILEAFQKINELLVQVRSAFLKKFVLENILKYVRPRVAYLGPEGTFTHEVTMRLFRDSRCISCSSITEVFKSVINGEVDVGVVPFENSIEGIVHETLDALQAFNDIYINLCVEHKINLCLIASDDVNSLEDIQKLYVQPYAYAQCRSFVTRNLRNLKDVIFVESTARSLELAISDRKAACIASRMCAELKGGKILCEHVEDFESYTKFIVISRRACKVGDRTSVIFFLKHEPGQLYKVLEVFASRGINLTMIYSRPTRRVPWQYYFYLEYEGSVQDDIVDELRERCLEVKILGSYMLISS